MINYNMLDTEQDDQSLAHRLDEFKKQKDIEDMKKHITYNKGPEKSKAKPNLLTSMLNIGEIDG